VQAQRYIGLMSGTSVDAIDAALIEIDNNGTRLVASHQHAIPDKVRNEIAAISLPGDNEIERLGPLDRQLGRLFAEATLALISSAGGSSGSITAIGSHGQTVRHRPASSGREHASSFSLQIGDPNTIAELTGITTVADFRRRDMAAGGEGAPLAPAFHAAAFSADEVNRAVVNIGGIANVSLMQGKNLLAGFDTGPGNTLLDIWAGKHLDAPFDRDGKWASSGSVLPNLLARLMSHPYFELSGPRSTGKEDFNAPWLEAQLNDAAPQDVQATLAEFTAHSIAKTIQDSEIDVGEVYICGGGAHNTDLMERLERALNPASVASTEVLGLHPDWVEAATFAWLAHQTLAGLAGNAPTVTGAAAGRVLGGIYPSSQ
jgi:anhydro-N-acetylmuramic acid kinase